MLNIKEKRYDLDIKEKMFKRHFAFLNVISNPVVWLTVHVVCEVGRDLGLTFRFLCQCLQGFHHHCSVPLTDVGGRHVHQTKLSKTLVSQHPHLEKKNSCVTCLHYQLHRALTDSRISDHNKMYNWLLN